MKIKPHDAERLFGQNWRAKVTLSPIPEKDGWVRLKDWPDKKMERPETPSMPAAPSLPNGLGTLVQLSKLTCDDLVRLGFDKELATRLAILIAGSGNRCAGKRIVDKINALVPDVNTFTRWKSPEFVVKIRECVR